MIRNQDQISKLLYKLVDNEISDEEFLKLRTFFSSEPHAKEFYFQFMADYSLLTLRATTTFAQDDKKSSQIVGFDNDMWEQLSEVEQSSPVVERLRPVIKEEVHQKRVIVKQREKKASKFPLLAAVTSAAAMLLFIAYIHFSPRIVEVAEIADSINAVWAEDSLAAVEGVRLSNNSSPLHLLKGLVKIRFDNGAEVVVEGPAEINLNSPGQMLLSYGQISVDVPDQATGFTVETPYSSIVDLGTKFGVKVELDGSTDIHMFEGRASLVPGKKGQASKGRVLTTGNSMRVKAGGLLRDIAFDARAFVKKINSKTNLIWRGKHIDLADIVGGGNGFGTAEDCFGVNPLTGKNISVWPGVSATEDEQSMPGPFRQAQSKWIDGVFIPDGGEGPVQIAQDGLSFAGFDDTSGKMWAYLQHQKKSFELSTDDNPNMDGKACILMHANVGITFDLDKIRKRFDGQVDIKAFRSQTGFRTPGFYNNKVDFLILVDGQVRHQKLGVLTTAELDDVEVLIGPFDRYLTLVVTESDDKLDQDWTMFVSPTLILK